MQLRLVLGRACLALLVLAVPGTSTAQEPPKPEPAVTLLTAAERTDYQATSRYEEVLGFCRQLAQQSPLVALTEWGTSVEGRSLPLLILAEPRVENPEQARASGKLVVFAMGNIHAGEVCGKEALLMLVRELATAADRALLKDVVFLVAPLVNADGNERISVENRPDQAGPPQGVGVRANAQGLDLNRDFVKLDTPEIRALVRLFNRWDPAVTIDCHTTNGSYHRYALTYDSPRHPATHAEIIRYTRDEFLPEVSRRLEQQAGYKTFFYGDFAADHARWETYPALPRVGIQYFGVRNRVAILSEAYAYAPFRERVLATRGFVHTCLQLCAEQRQKVADLVKAAGNATQGRVEQPESAKLVPLRSQPAVLGKFPLAGFVEQQQDGHTVATQEPRDYEAEYLGVEQTTVSVRRPEGYLIPETCRTAVDILLRHGIAVQQLREDIELDVELYSIRELSRGEQPYENHTLATLETEARAVAQRFPAGTYFVRTDQPLGTLAMLLLEPQSPDGLATWNCLGSELTAGQDFPIARLPRWAPVLTAPKSAPEDSPREKKPLNYEAVFGNRPVDLSGNPTSGLRWLEDGEHFLQFKEGQLWKVHAATGRSVVFYEKAAVQRALETIEGLDARAAERLADQVRQGFDPQVKAAVLEHQNDLYYVTLNGERALRLTDSPAREELATFSPDGQRVAFVRQNDLHVVDVRSGKGRQLTEGGSETLRRGKTDWVYFEEVNNRNWQAYRWSPDSQSIAFLEFDDERVVPFTVVNPLAIQQQVETERFPLAGQPNPQVRLGVVRASGGEVRWLDLGKYSPDNMLITNFGWFPNSQEVYFYVQDRTQRWLDFNRGQICRRRDKHAVSRTDGGLGRQSG